jgi:hypoxanthine phosphoribosyltransferase
MEIPISDRHDIRGYEHKWKLILSHQEILQYVDKCANYINSNFKGKNLILVCILKGAIWFFSDLTKRLIIPNLFLI